MLPALSRRHRVVAVDLLGHDGSEKPASGYSIPDQAEAVGEALERLHISHAEVVGHSLGGPVTLALAERSPQIVDRMVLIDSIPDDSYGSVGLIGELPFKPVLGELLWRIKPDFSIKDGLKVAFAPGYDVPDAFVDDVKRMTYSSYSGSHGAFDSYTGEKALPQRAAAVAKPTLAMFGAEEQIANDPRKALAAYRAADPGIETKLIAGAGHSPNVEKPAETAQPSSRIWQNVPESLGFSATRRGGAAKSRSIYPSRASLKRFWGSQRCWLASSAAACQSRFRRLPATRVAVSRCRPRTGVPYEPMFDSKQTLTNRLADAADLLIDFATLGEYGLEPVGRTAQPCEADRRPPAARQPRDPSAPPRPPRSRPSRPSRPSPRTAPTSTSSAAPAPAASSIQPWWQRTTLEARVARKRESGAFEQQAGSRRRAAWRSSATRAPLRGLNAQLIRRQPGRASARPGPPQKNRRRPTLPGGCPPSTIGAEWLNCSVRNGKRCFPLAMRHRNFARPPRWSLKTAQGLKVSNKNIRQALDPLVPVG